MPRPIALAIVWIAIGVGSCGYRPALGGAAHGPLHVKLVRTLIPDAVASDEVAAGIREELARAGALAGGDGFPRVEVEVLRVGETSEGIAARGGTSAGPIARGTSVGVTARAWIVVAQGAEPERDTGDLRAEDVLAADSAGGLPDPRASLFHDADGRRAAARRLGRELGQRVLGGRATLGPPMGMP